MLFPADLSVPGARQPVLLTPDFASLATTFAGKSDRELRLAYWMFRLMEIPWLMKVAGWAATQAVKRKLPVKSLIRNTIYRHFCGGESVYEALEVVSDLNDAHIRTVLDYAAEAEETEAGYEKVKRHILYNISLAASEKGIGAVSVKLSGLGSRHIFEKMAQGFSLEQAEKDSFQRTGLRLEEICRQAAEAGICVYLDAEESWIQEPLDALAEHMMQLFNKQRVVVFNTLQMYRTDRLTYLKELISRTEGVPFLLGIKLVRGAYWEKERERAAQLGLPSPVFDTKAGTDRHFNEAILVSLDQLPRVQLCIATHNQESTELLVQEIQRRGLQNHQQMLHFSQLFGMSDNLSTGLAMAGYSTSKYLPYGEVEKALPYLIRRAEENTAIAGQMGRERQILRKELHRRRTLREEKSTVILRF